MAFTGKEKHTITLATASKLTRNHRENVEDGAIKGQFFGKETLQRILKQKGCVGIRCYFGKTDDGKPSLVLVGVDKEQNDLIKGELADLGGYCPPLCSVANKLNS